MARSEHSREAYRLLFRYVGAGLQALTVLLVLASLPVAPLWLVLGLLGSIVVTAWWSWRRFASNFMMPTFIGILQAVLWSLVMGIGVGIMRW